MLYPKSIYDRIEVYQIGRQHHMTCNAYEFIEELTRCQNGKWFSDHYWMKFSFPCVEENNQMKVIPVRNPPAQLFSKARLNE